MYSLRLKQLDVTQYTNDDAMVETSSFFPLIHVLAITILVCVFFVQFITTDVTVSYVNKHVSLHGESLQ